jgi:hypothetical protein
MIRRKNPALSCANTGPVSAATSPDPALHQASSGRTEHWSAVSCWENRLICAACHHNVVRSAPQAMQP